VPARLTSCADATRSTNPNGPSRLTSALVPSPETAIQPRFNVSPSQSVPRHQETVTAKVDLEMMALGGFRPAWMAGKGQAPATNQRAQRDAARKADVQGHHQQDALPDPGRWLLRVEGGPRGQKTKQPMHIRLKDHEVYAFAGLWVGGLVTTSGQPARSSPARRTSWVATIHDRMPVILTRQGRATLARR